MLIECSKVTTDSTSLAIGDVAVIATMSVVSILTGKNRNHTKIKIQRFWGLSDHYNQFSLYIHGQKELLYNRRFTLD